MAVTAINPQNKSLFPRRCQEKRARTTKEIISKRMSSAVGRSRLECRRGNADVIDSFSITVATKLMRHRSLPIQAFCECPGENRPVTDVAHEMRIGASRYENKGRMKIRVIGDDRGSGGRRIIGGEAGNGARSGLETDPSQTTLRINDHALFY
jgi:hypothetical protein